MGFAAALTEFFERYDALHPVNATFTGVHALDDLLPDWSPAGLERAAGTMQAVRDRLRIAGVTTPPPVPPRGDDIAWEGLDAAVADSVLEIRLAEDRSHHFARGNPSLAIGEAVFGVIALMTREYASFPERLDVAIARLQAVPAFLDGVLATFAGAALPAEWTARALRECEGARHLFGSGVRLWCSTHGAPALFEDLARRAGDVALAAVARFEAALRATPIGPAIATCGTGMLEHLVRRGHWCDTPLDELLARARAAFADARATLETMVRKAGFASWPELQQHLASQHQTASTLQGALQATWTRCRAAAEAHALLTWPDDWPIRFVPVPPWTRDAAPFLYYLHYRAPAPFDRLPVHDYITPALDALPDDGARETVLRAWNDSQITQNHIVHHAAIGHHVQNRHAYHSPSRIGRLAAVDCASRIAMFCGGTLAEGWACYVTDVMEEVDFYTPLERVAQQHTRVRLLARAIVDIELHRGQLGFDAAVELYTRDAFMPAAAARAEVVKNSMFPGTAFMYWLGTQSIHELRRGCAAAEGAAFSLRAFHDELLSFGALPVPLIASIMLARRATEAPRAI